jgi:hypothetical protein
MATVQSLPRDFEEDPLQKPRKKWQLIIPYYGERENENH